MSPWSAPGPFQLVERREGQYLRFAANKNYWRGAPKFDELVFRVFTNADAEAQALVRGEIDFAYDLPSNVFNSLNGKPGVTTRSSEVLRVQRDRLQHRRGLADGTAIGDGHEALKNKQVRLAISHAIDRKTLVDRVLNGHGSPGDSFIPPVYPLLHYHADRAAELRPGQGRTSCSTRPDIPKKADGTRFGLRLFSRQESQDSPSTAEFVKSWLKEIGIDVTVKVMSEDTLTEVIGQGELRHVRVGLGGRTRPRLPDVGLHLRQAQLQGRRLRLRRPVRLVLLQPGLRRALRAAGRETDQAKRAELAKRMQQLVYDDAAVRDHLLLRRPGRLPQRPLDRLHRPARPRRVAAVPVRHPLLPDDRPKTADRARGRAARRWGPAWG